MSYYEGNFCVSFHCGEEEKCGKVKVCEKKVIISEMFLLKISFVALLTGAAAFGSGLHRRRRSVLYRV